MPSFPDIDQPSDRVDLGTDLFAPRRKKPVSDGTRSIEEQLAMLIEAVAEIPRLRDRIGYLQDQNVAQAQQIEELQLAISPYATTLPPWDQITRLTAQYFDNTASNNEYRCRTGKIAKKANHQLKLKVWWTTAKARKQSRTLYITLRSPNNYEFSRQNAGQLDGMRGKDVHLAGSKLNHKKEPVLVACLWQNGGLRLMVGEHEQELGAGKETPKGSEPGAYTFLWQWYRSEST